MIQGPQCADVHSLVLSWLASKPSGPACPAAQYCYMGLKAYRASVLTH